jgi:hypothetical protein
MPQVGLAERIQQVLRERGGQVTFVAVVNNAGKVETALAHMDGVPQAEVFRQLEKSLRQFADILDVAVREPGQMGRG